MARREMWIGMAVAIPATVAFTPFHPLEPPPQEPNVVAPTQPIVATTPAASAQPIVATTPATPAQAIVATAPTAAAQPITATTPTASAQPIVATTPATPAQAIVATAPVTAAPATPQGLAPGSGTTAAPKPDVGPIVVDAALTRVGAPYAWGAAGPDSFDCSGLVVWAFHQAGITVPHSSEALAIGGQLVALDQMQPGDVISLFPDASHVGIYVGDGRMIHAQFEGLPVIVESLRSAPINDVRRYG